MIRSLWTSASGLASQRAAVDAIANNVANVNTNGFKRNVPQFQDLFYQQANALGEFEPSTASRTGISIGTGVRVASTQKLFSQGRLEQTGNQLDIAIEGEGFYRVLMPNGTPAYTRDGSFLTDESGRLMTPQGYKLDSEITIPAGAEVTVYPNGTVSVRDPETGELHDIGAITIFRVENPGGLMPVGENVFVPTAAVGEVVEEMPEGSGVGKLVQGFVEGSNVELAEEMTQLVIAQRAYEINSRALKTADDMLAIALSVRS